MLVSSEICRNQAANTGSNMARKFVIDQETAVRRLTNRYAEQCERWPTLQERIPLALYIERNIMAVRLGNAPLEKYDRA